MTRLKAHVLLIFVCVLFVRIALADLEQVADWEVRSLPDKVLKRMPNQGRGEYQFIAKTHLILPNGKRSSRRTLDVACRKPVGQQWEIALTIDVILNPETVTLRLDGVSTISVEYGDSGISPQETLRVLEAMNAATSMTVASSYGTFGASLDGLTTTLTKVLNSCPAIEANQISSTLGLDHSGQPTAQHEAMAENALIAFRRRDYDAAIPVFAKLANQGHAMSQYMMGEAYVYGYAVEPSYEEAFKWYSASAEQGHAESQNGLGGMYFSGTGVEEDEDAAVRWWRAAADQGNHSAQTNLGHCYRDGDGVSQDDYKAFVLYRGAAESGYLRAMRSLAYMYKNGLGTEPDRRLALFWYQKAAGRGDLRAKDALSNWNKETYDFMDICLEAGLKRVDPGQAHQVCTQKLNRGLRPEW